MSGGLCIYIEYNGKKILLDTGASGLFAENAGKLGLSLEEIDYAVLSHAHYDHSDGMRHFFQINQKAKFYLREGCLENCYAKKWIFTKYIGIGKGILEEHRHRLVYVSGDYPLMEGVSLIPHKTPGLSSVGSREKMYRKDGKKWKPDDFSHEQSLVFDTPEGIVIFNYTRSYGKLSREKSAGISRRFPSVQQIRRFCEKACPGNSGDRNYIRVYRALHRAEGL